jgi:capsid protein (F protein)
MSLTQAYTFKAPNRSNYDLSHAAFLSTDVGYVKPVSCIEVLGNDSMSLNLGSIVETAPTFAPVYGRMHQSFRTFFIPRRLYSTVNQNSRILPAIFNPEGATEETVNVLKFLPCTFTQIPISGDVISGNRFSVGEDVAYEDVFPLTVGRGSVYEMFGMPNGQSSLALVEITTIPPKVAAWASSNYHLNGIPFIGYLDLIYNYYSNHHAGRVPIRLSSYSNASDARDLIENDVFWLDIAKLSQFLTDVKTGRAVYMTADFYLLSSDLMVVNSLYNCFWGSVAPSSEVSYSFNGRHAGLSFCTPMPDINTSWISDTEYADWLAKAIVPVSSNQVKYEDIITASSLYRRAAKLALGDGTFDDFYAAVNGIRADTKATVPQYVGGFSRNLDFQQIRATAETSEANLGSYAGYMSQASGGHLVNFFTREPGYLITIMTVYPEFTYGGGIDSALLKTRVEDFYSPDFANIGYQPRLLREVQAFTSVDYSDGSLIGTPKYGAGVLNSSAIGYQPAWTEYTTAVNRSYGDLGPGGEKDFWTFHAPYVYGGFSFEYISPSDFSYIFATKDLSVDNYFVQVGFNIKARRSIPKRLMPSLKL